MSDNDLIGIIEKNRGEDIRTTISTFSGAPMIDVRIFATVGHAENRIATKKGVALRIDYLPQLIDHLNRAVDRARERGLLA